MNAGTPYASVGASGANWVGVEVCACVGGVVGVGSNGKTAMELCQLMPLRRGRFQIIVGSD